jgi:methylmalonyl-CoA mutase C-terminal domain/subunit
MPMATRVLLVQDSTGHSTGYHVVARGLRDAGFEVILGGALVPREVAQLAAEEAVDAIGYRIMDAEPTILVEHLFANLHRIGFADVPVVVGGIVPDADLHRLEQLGAAAVFRPGATMEEIAATFRTLTAAAPERRG